MVNIVSQKFPDDKDLEYTKSQIELGVSVSPLSTITSFINNTRPYLEKILHKDEGFFLTVVEDHSAFKGMAISTKWHELTQSEKDHMWKNVQKMIVLGNKILTE